MSIKLSAGGLLLVAAVPLLGGCLFGGGGAKPASVSRPGSIPTATISANPPAPILLNGDQSATGGQTAAAVAGAASTYTIKSGDTLNAIAAANGITGDQLATWTADVLRINGITDARLLAVGQEITLPPTTTPRVSTTPSPSATTAARTPTTAAGTTTPAASATRPSGSVTPASTPAGGTTPATASGRTYVVVSGDNPTAIGAKLGVPDSQLASWAAQLLSLNNTTATGLNIGQTLQLPASTP